MIRGNHYFYPLAWIIKAFWDIFPFIWPNSKRKEKPKILVFAFVVLPLVFQVNHYTRFCVVLSYKYFFPYFSYHLLFMCILFQWSFVNLSSWFIWLYTILYIWVIVICHLFLFQLFSSLKYFYFLSLILLFFICLSFFYHCYWILIIWIFVCIFLFPSYVRVW